MDQHRNWSYKTCILANSIIWTRCSYFQLELYVQPTMIHARFEPLPFWVLSLYSIRPPFRFRDGTACFFWCFCDCSSSLSCYLSSCFLYSYTINRHDIHVSWLCYDRDSLNLWRYKFFSLLDFITCYLLATLGATYFILKLHVIVADLMLLLLLEKSA
jgi:hypothetical protein